MSRKLLKSLLRQPPKKDQRVGPLARLINRIAGVVYPTNNSGNNMSVR